MKPALPSGSHRLPHSPSAVVGIAIRAASVLFDIWGEAGRHCMTVLAISATVGLPSESDNPQRVASLVSNIIVAVGLDVVSPRKVIGRSSTVCSTMRSPSAAISAGRRGALLAITYRLILSAPGSSTSSVAPLSIAAYTFSSDALSGIAEIVASINRA